MAYDLLGKNFTPPDLHAKVTGKAKYSEDIRADGMVFVKLLTSPMPHARVTSIDASAALAMPGVHGVLTADEVENSPEPQETILTNEPLFVGHPILAVAADTEELATDALEQIKVTYEELPFTVDPLQSLFPGGPNARTNGNVATRRRAARTSNGRRRISRPLTKGNCRRARRLAEWSFGDVDAGFAAAKLVLDETFVTAGLGHHSMEPRSALRVLAERQVLSVRLDAEPELPDTRNRAPLRRRAGGSRLRLRVLRRRLRLEGRRLSADGDTRAHGEEDRSSRDDAHLAARGVLHGLGAPRFPRPHQDGLRRRRPRHGRRPLYSAGERPEPRASTIGARPPRPSRSSTSRPPCGSAACPC